MRHISRRVVRVVMVVAMTAGGLGVGHTDTTAAGASPVTICDTTGTVSWGPVVGVVSVDQLFTISGSGSCRTPRGSQAVHFSGSGNMNGAGCCYLLPIATPCLTVLGCPTWYFRVDMTIGGLTASETWWGDAEPAVSRVEGHSDSGTQSEGLLFSQIFLQNPPSPGHDTAFRLIFCRTDQATCAPSVVGGTRMAAL